LTIIQPGFTKKDAVRAAWVFGVVFVSTFTVAVTGTLKDLVTSCKAGACDMATAKAGAVAAILAAIPTAVLAVKNFTLKDSSTLKG
jgi:hypothetical protein